VLGVLRSDRDDLDLAPPPSCAADIARLIASSRDAGMTIELDGDVPELPDATARAVYRVVQEAITNARKHAPGAVVGVSVTGEPSSDVTVVVTNGLAVNGRGEELPGSGHGLVGLRERVRLLGGTFSCGPVPGGGWRVEAHVPWAGQPQPA